MNLLLDTSAYSAVMKGERSVIVLIDSAESIFMTPIVMGELYYGFLKGNRRTENTQKLEAFVAKSQVIICDVKKEVSNIYAELRLAQQLSGLSLAANDLWIAATAIYLNARLATFDKDFLRIEHKGFQVVCLS